MGNSNDIKMHTRKLLANGVFDHLTDDKISVLHHLIMSVTEIKVDQKLFFDFWRKGDFSNNIQHLQLLHETNYLLHFYGEHAIDEVFLEVEFEY